MKLIDWARGLTLWGILGAILSFLPAMAAWLLPPHLVPEFFAVTAIMLALGVTPLAVAIASVGVCLLLLALLRRGRS